MRAFSSFGVNFNEVFYLERYKRLIRSEFSPRPWGCFYKRQREKCPFLVIFLTDQTEMIESSRGNGRRPPTSCLLFRQNLEALWNQYFSPKYIEHAYEGLLGYISSSSSFN